ncbi:tRNA 2-selenouridine(34) synthase MnmH [Campylobacter estrildidarum]|uniref:tRNA 2-selenouridine(34) synthase MnmH n=1 Tax=Campylobacter estrildidarum TaxID=2510189 RepID=A0A4U7BKN9_9BACT|nr:tRNA 2-selenouridine(34) synthase MnmH [Campylobacter estrildidarum]TKX32179.1 tRNA 2-selenouridine(34) synthase MnmH [Campylobacter estrildidarum]
MLSELEFENFNQENFDFLIDARSPKEFAHSHFQGALNFYALNDDEHQKIGTLYKQNQALAKAEGASCICANMSCHIPIIAQKFRIGSKVGIYCARGGLRSKAIAVILSELGYRVVRLKGGFKAYRAFLLKYFDKSLNLKLFALCGNTGCGKSELLELLPQAINLEKMANHLGSSFGDILGDQPTQKAFESLLFYAMKEIKNFAFIESESRKIGDIILPLKLYESMQNAFKIYCFCSLENRIRRIQKFYKDRMTPLKFKECVKRISPYVSMNFRQDLLQSYESQKLEKVISMLLEYYDKSYKQPERIDFRLNTDDILKAKEELLNFLKTKYKINF